jgi:hypothetical protein
VIVQRGSFSTKHVVYAADVVRGREAFCRKTGAEMSLTAWQALQERASMEWFVLVWPRTLEDPGFRADFHVAQVRLRGKRGPLRGQDLPPGEAMAQIVFTNSPFFPEEVSRVLSAMKQDAMPLLVDLWPAEVS